MGFFSFSKGKVITTIVLMLLAVLHVYLPYMVSTPGAFISLISTILLALVFPPAIARYGLIRMTGIHDESSWGVILFFIIALFWSYLLACVLAWIGSKILKKKDLGMDMNTGQPTNTQPTPTAQPVPQIQPVQPITTTPQTAVPSA